eukprot:4700670-Alexandrium_andersonii.AAC.1
MHAAFGRLSARSCLPGCPPWACGRVDAGAAIRGARAHPTGRAVLAQDGQSHSPYGALCSAQ